MNSYANHLAELQPDGVLIITINRPVQHSTLSIATVNELGAFLTEARGLPAVKAIVLTVTGTKSFIAGA